MALENGMTILLSKTYPQSNFFINGNHMDEELIFTQRGVLEEGLHEHAEAAGTIIQKALGGIPEGEVMGGIIYIHSNIP